MSAFCVFGMTEPVAKKIAERQFETMLRKLSKTQLAELDDAAEKAWIAEKTADILTSGKSIQVSPPFDAPQFAAEWIELARRTAKATRCRIMVRGEKLDKNGARIISKATKRPVMAWLNYSGPA